MAAGGIPLGQINGSYHRPLAHHFLVSSYHLDPALDKVKTLHSRNGVISAALQIRLNVLKIGHHFTLIFVLFNCKKSKRPGVRLETDMPVPRNVYLFLAVGLISASQSGNIVRLGEAHPLAIATWRLGIAALLMLPLAGRRLILLRGLSKVEYLLLGMSGLALGAHFFFFIGAVQNTTIANATIFFSLNPVITVTAAYFIFGERFNVNLFLAIALGLAGVIFLGGNDLSLKPEHLMGDALAILCTFFFSAYLLLGRRLRETLPNMVYVSAVYGVAAIFGFICLIFLDLPLIEYNGITWTCFLLMALIPTMLGHSSYNHALRYIGAGRISTATLSEPLLAGIVAFFAWGELITWAVFIGYMLICASVLVLVRDL